MSPTHLLSGAAIALFCATASATPIFDVFGPLPQATFGGTGIPNDEVAAGTQIEDGSNVITVALSATQRFSSPALTNDGAGTYFATPGTITAGDPPTTGALWNFNFYIEVVDGSGNALPAATYDFELMYEFNPSFDTPASDFGSIDITNSVLASADPTASVVQGSQNLNFGFLASDIPGFIDAPTGSFDPNALGEYTFSLTATQRTGLGLTFEAVAIEVVVVPAGSTAALFVPAGLLAMRRRRA